MISAKRIYHVLRKDLIWAKNNPKMLTIMLMPIFFIVLFSKIGKSSTMAFTFNFTSSFIGILSTTQFIIEEKKSGTLQSILISPLKHTEYLIAKYLFSLLLILIFDVLTIFLNGETRFFYNPYLMISIAAYAGYTSLIGCFLGIFLNDEKEVGVVSPFILLFFLLGDPIAKIPMTAPFAALLPSFHIDSLLNISADFDRVQLLFHSFFNIVFSSLAFYLTAFYTKYYFSPHRESRIPLKIVIPLSIFFLGHFASYQINKIYFDDVQREDQSSFKTISINFGPWKGSFTYDPKTVLFDKHFQNDDSVYFTIVDPEINQSVHLYISKIPTKSRSEKDNVKTDNPAKKRKFILLGVRNLKSKTQEFERKIKSFKGKGYLDIEPLTCKEYELYLKVDVEKEKVNEFIKVLGFLDNTLENLNLECSTD